MDSLRALAATGVVLVHVVNVNAAPGPVHAWWGVFPQTLDVAVALFFVVSGFLIYRPYVNAQLNGAPSVGFGTYLRRRALRILPAYWLALTVLAVYPGLSGVFTGDWWRYYFLLSGMEQHAYAMGLLVSWSLAVEITFYLALPFYARLMGRLGRGRGIRGRLRIELAALALLAVVSFAIRTVDYVTHPSIAVQQSLPTFLYWFALGMALAVVSAGVQGGLRLRLVDAVRAHPGRCWAGALAVYAALCVIENPQGTHSTFQWVVGYYGLGGLFAALLALPATLGDDGGGWPRRVLAWRRLAWTGLVSYGLYLWHVPIITVLAKHGVHGFLPLTAASLAASLLCAAGSYYLVERPLLRLKYRRPSRSQPSGAERPAQQPA